jgi:hypothetical protein
MTAQACPGGCNSRYWKAWDAYDKAVAAYDPLNPATSRPEPPEVRWRADGEPVWCGEHTAQIRRELASLDDLSALLLRTADGYESQPRTERAGSSPEPRSPSPAAEKLDELDRLLTSWEKGYRDLMGWDSPPKRGTDADRRTTCIAWLTSHLDGILTSAYATEFGWDVLAWRKLLARDVKGEPPPGRRLPLRCPKPGGCGLLTLTRKDANRVECANPACQRSLSWDKYEEEVGHAAAAVTAGS